MKTFRALRSSPWMLIALGALLAAAKPMIVAQSTFAQEVGAAALASAASQSAPAWLNIVAAPR